MNNPVNLRYTESLHIASGKGGSCMQATPKQVYPSQCRPQHGKEANNKKSNRSGLVEDRKKWLDRGVKMEFDAVVKPKVEVAEGIIASRIAWLESLRDAKFQKKKVSGGPLLVVPVDDQGNVQNQEENNQEDVDLPPCSRTDATRPCFELCIIQ